MSVHKSEQIVVGVDVGGPRKGFHAVALRDGSYLSRSASKDAGWIVNWCRDIGPPRQTSWHRIPHINS